MDKIPQIFLYQELIYLKYSFKFESILKIK